MAALDFYQEIEPLLSDAGFPVNCEVATTDYFPDFLKGRLDSWKILFESSLLPVIYAHYPELFGGAQPEILRKIENFNESICRVITCYYNGQVADASEVFKDAMDKIFAGQNLATSIIDSGKSFYRCRRPEFGKAFGRKDLFHIPFEQRTKVSTNRYSIPGFPALYVGDSTYVCWEEGGQYKFSELMYSRIESLGSLMVIEILLLNDFKKKLDGIESYDTKVQELFRYIILTPLILSCTCRVKDTQGSFKPEYVVPQMLLQYVVKKGGIDGIMYPSSKVDYARVRNVPAYNYVFPVAPARHEKGYCHLLKNKFHLTVPTSLDMEKVGYNPRFPQTVIFASNTGDGRMLEMPQGVERNYTDTSFGHLEQILSRWSIEAIT